MAAFCSAGLHARAGLAWRLEVAVSEKQPPNEVKELGLQEEGKGMALEARASNSEKKPPRLRLRSIDDTLQVHARVLRAAWGKADPDTYSRMLARHSKLLETRILQTMAVELKSRVALLREAKRVLKHDPEGE